MSKWENALGKERMQQHLNKQIEAAASNPEHVLVARET